MDTKTILACGFLFLGGIALLILSVMTNSSVGLGLSTLFALVCAIPLVICAWKGAFSHADTEEPSHATHQQKEDEHEHT